MIVVLLACEVTMVVGVDGQLNACPTVHQGRSASR